MTIDPAHDGPKEVGQYAAMFNAPIIGLTGSQAQIDQVKKQFGIFAEPVPHAAMGKEMEHGERALIFKPYQLSTDTVTAAAPDVMVLHCLPAHRGEEIAAEVMDGPNSAVFDQAENRLHTQKALLSWLLTGSADPS